MLSDAAATISTCDLLQKLVAHNNQSEPIPAHSSRYRLSDWCRSFVRRAWSPLVLKEQGVFSGEQIVP